MKELNDIYEKLGTIQGTQNMILAEMRSGFKQINELTNIHTNKIDCLENEVGEIKTKATIFGAGAGVGIMIIWEFIKNKIFKQ